MACPFMNQQALCSVIGVASFNLGFCSVGPFVTCLVGSEESPPPSVTLILVGILIVPVSVWHQRIPSSKASKASKAQLWVICLWMA